MEKTIKTISQADARTFQRRAEYHSPEAWLQRELRKIETRATIQADRWNSRVQVARNLLNDLDAADSRRGEW